MSEAAPRPGAFPPDLFAGRRFAVLGLGRNGEPAVRALAAMGAGVQAWDDRATLVDPPPGVVLAPFDDLRGFDALVLSPGIPHRLPAPHPVAAMALASAVPILSDAELLFQAVRCAGSRARFAGITGTNGKSTTTALLVHLCREAGIPAAAGGNLGPAALALPLLPDDGIYVLEMSSYMLERLSTLRFDAACLLNLSPDHLDRHGDMDGYRDAKLRIFERQRPDDLAVLGFPAFPPTAARVEILPEPSTIPPRDSMLPGAHNRQNIAAAVLMARHLGVSDAAIDGGVASFAGLPHRQQLVAVHDGRTFVNDSKATNAESAAVALGCYDRIAWIAGGIAKAGGIDSLVPFFPRIVHASLYGRDAGELARPLARHAVPHSLHPDLRSALGEASAVDADIVLFSPACASFDQFANFEARGDAFISGVRSLTEAGQDT
ncbi:MAG: UDP-N-acetylmuramoyl-L-alanine--D-glutamate ligase [Gluconacetobacter diazotrophicus]|nr:UDP-N-acetylmuramoyl-L-alanine--D-glutamate ligase [Gluconacetobacter diazotrophicus]